MSSTTPEHTTYLTEKMENKVRLRQFDQMQRHGTGWKEEGWAEGRFPTSKHGSSLQQGLVYCWLGLVTPDCHIRNWTAIQVTCECPRYLPFLPIRFVIGIVPNTTQPSFVNVRQLTCLLPAFLLSSALCRCIQQASGFISGQALDFIKQLKIFFHHHFCCCWYFKVGNE